MFKQLKRSKGQLFLLLHSSQLHIERTIKEKFAVPCKIRNRPWCHYYLDYYYYGVILLQLLLGLLLWCYLASWFLRSKSIYMQKGHNSQAICTTKMKIGFCLTDSMSAPIMFKLQSHIGLLLYEAYYFAPASSLHLCLPHHTTEPFHYHYQK